EAFHYRELLRREPRLRAERAAPSDALLFRVIALNSDRTEPPEAAWAELAERFAPEDPPAGAKQALADELARPVSDSMAALLADARDEPLLQGVARLRCFYMGMSRLFSPAVRLDCARLGYRLADRTPFADAWGDLRLAANAAVNVLGSQGYGPALLFGAERHLQARGMKPPRWAFEWLLLAERAGAETEPLMSHVKGRLDPREIEAATLNVRTLGIPPPLR
ncbi:MAG: hypothetical protein NXI21_19360, partial [Alphaproteobacteria bacterium]|nr:hypothetical protein [Alphaproteobacteria bacterium]